jgi:hypothetical protein
MIPTKINSKIICFGSDDYAPYIGKSSSIRLKRELDEDLTVSIAPRDDAFNDVRQEYSDMLQNQLAKGNYGIRRSKFLSFSIAADKKLCCLSGFNGIDYFSMLKTS